MARVVSALVQRVHGGCRAAVALAVLLPADEAQRNAGADVGNDGQGHEQGLAECRLVDFACHEEVGFGGGHGAGYGRDEGDVGEVQRCEDGHGVAREALDSGDYRKEG